MHDSLACDPKEFWPQTAPGDQQIIFLPSSSGGRWSATLSSLPALVPGGAGTRSRDRTVGEICPSWSSAVPSSVRARAWCAKQEQDRRGEQVWNVEAAGR